jgi:hypothetical protein
MGDLSCSLARRLSAGDGQLPLPGSGRTLQRWQMLADVAAEDLALAKLFEGHTDALAIMAELGGAAAEPGSAWGTWAAEPPTARLELRRTADGVRLTGRKAWCSGAEIVTDAVVTAWDQDGAQCLAAVAVGQPAVTVTTEGWHAVGMGRAASGDVLFDAAAAAEEAAGPCSPTPAVRSAPARCAGTCRSPAGSLTFRSSSGRVTQNVTSHNLAGC